KGTAPTFGRRRRVLMGALGFLAWMMAAILTIILPVPRLPAPPGPYAVGSVTFDWTDTTRAESYSPDSSDKRELMVQIWYPAQPDAHGKTIPFLDNFDVALSAFADFLELPSFALDHLRLVRTHTHAGAPIQNDGAPYPVVIY